MSEKNLEGNTLLFQKEALFENVTNIATKEYSKNRFNKSKKIYLIISIVAALLIIGVFVAALFIKESTPRIILIIVSIVAFLIDLLITIFFQLSRPIGPNDVITPNKLIVTFYDDSLFSSLFHNESQISTYIIFYNQINKVLIKNNFLTIFNSVTSPLTIDLNGFQNAENITNLEKILKNNNITIEKK